MLKLVLFVLWLPINLALLAFSLTVLSNFHPKDLLTYKSDRDVVFAQELIKITSTPVPTIADFATKIDMRVTVLQKFLQNYNSPLYSEASYLVYIADRWGFDYAIIPAISMQESNGCRVIPVNSFNCWGFGIYGNTVTRFSSYEETISAVAKTIKESYIKNGLVNATLLENKWAPQSNGQWSYAVNYFIGKIRDLEKNIPAS